MPVSKAEAMIEPQEAFLMFEKWHSERTRLLCIGAFYGWNLQSQGRISTLSNQEIQIDFLDTLGRIVLRLDQEDLGFEYAEPKDAKPDVRKLVPGYARDLGTLLVALPLRLTLSQFQSSQVPAREKLFFMEVPEGGFPPDPL